MLSVPESFRCLSMTVVDYDILSFAPGSLETISRGRKRFHLT